MKNKLLEALCKAKTVAVSGHVRSDGDCVGSCMALYHYIKDNYADTKAVVFLEPVADSYKVLDGTENIVSDSESDEIFDLFVVLDCGDESVSVHLQNILTCKKDALHRSSYKQYRLCG